MGFELNVSNSLDELSVKIFENFESKDLPVFQPHFVVTQTEGMNNWLKLQLANRQGIAANVRFLKPNDLIQKVHYLLGGKYVGTLSPGNISWVLYRILGEPEFQVKFPAIAAYYIGEDENSSIRRMALAEKVADLFDQYQVYRTDYIEEWNNASPVSISNDDWQKYLWARTKELTGDKMIDKIVMSRMIIESLSDPLLCDELKARIPALHIFGISITTPYHLRIFEALARHIDVCFYLLNPAPEQYWLDTISEKQANILVSKGKAKAADVVVGNSLLTSWGRIIKETFSLLFENDEFLNAYEPVNIHEPGTDSLLHKIQHDIFNNSDSHARYKLDDADLKDGSITINSCYTIAREVETLYNYLVHLVDKKNEQLSPREIVVMVSDINAYAPYIKAVFNNAPYAFNYTIADESFTNNDNIVNALKAVMEISEEDFKAEEVVQLLDSTYIRRRCGVSNIALIREIVDRANIRFGTKGNREDDTSFVSWKYGLQRIIFGICISGEDEFIANGESLYPVDVIEGSDSAELVRFAYFVEVLMASLEERKQNRTISSWVDHVRSLVQNLVYQVGGTINEDHIFLQQQLDAYNELNNVYSEPVSYEVFSHSLLQSLSAATRSSAFAGGGITFCSLIPMRSIPFKVVAMLGLNFDKFPRKETSYSFNLMEKERRKGDRNVKDNDKHLFLETLLSAKKYLYISYLGQSVKDNSILPPSALVDELIDYIQSGCEKDTVMHSLVTRHPLHGFSRRYSSGDETFFNYIIDKPGTGHDFINKEKDILPGIMEELSITSFINFFRNPIKSYYNEVLRIRYDEEAVLLNETEVFELDGLQQWSLKNQLLLAEKNELPALRDRLVRTGSLPLKNMSIVQMQQVNLEIETTRELFRETIGDRTCDSKEIELELGPTVLKGRLENVYDDELVFVCFSSNENKYLLEAYIMYLVGIAAGVIRGLQFISEKKGKVFTAERISQRDAEQRLELLLDLYLRGHQHILLFYPDLKLSPAEIESMDMKAYKKALDDRFDNHQFPCTDKYALRQFDKGTFTSIEAMEEFREYSGIILGPLVAVFPNFFK